MDSSDVDNTDVLGLLSTPTAKSEETSVLEDDSSVEDGKILLWSMEFRSNGCIPHFANPAFIFVMENAFSKGVLTTRENSRFDTTKSLFENDKAWTALLKCDFNDLKTDTSRVGERVLCAEGDRTV